MFKRFYSMVAIALLTLLAIIAVSSAATPIEHTFTLKLPDGAIKPKTVNLAGDFNKWSATANAMHENNGAYSVTIELTPGLHQYKFVIDGENWIEDSAADKKLEQPDGLGGQNSGVNVDAAPSAPAPATPNASDADGHVFTYAPAANSPKPTNVYLAGDFNGWSTAATHMAEKDGTYQATVKLTPGVHHYKFVVDGGDWKNDPKADPKLDEDDGNGGHNSGVQIVDSAKSAPAPTP